MKTFSKEILDEVSEIVGNRIANYRASNNPFGLGFEKEGIILELERFQKKLEFYKLFKKRIKK